MRTYIKDLSSAVGNQVDVYAWIDVRRDQGKMVFFDLRDATGKVQAVVLPNHTEALEVAQKVRPEWVIKVTAQVNKRPERNIKEGVLNGDIELEVLAIDILNEAETPAFDISTDGYEVSEDVRLEKKYLDQRRARMQHNIRTRHKVMKFLRDELDKQNFLEIETPLLTNPTPEGSRSYLVPSRIWSGNFYALPQSPQQYKQLLMAGGFEAYFQFAKCMRDEDTRGDRQPEFTQLDMEMSFVSQEDVMKVNEELLINLVREISRRSVSRQFRSRVSHTRRRWRSTDQTSQTSAKTRTTRTFSRSCGWLTSRHLKRQEKTMSTEQVSGHSRIIRSRE